MIKSKESIKIVKELYLCKLYPPATCEYLDCNVDNVVQRCLNFDHSKQCPYKFVKEYKE